MIEPRLNPDWYRVKYNLAALHANWAAETEEAKPESPSEQRRLAHAEARELAEKALEQLVGPSGKASEGLRSLLEKSILPATLVIYAGTAAPDAVEEAGAEEAPATEAELLDRLRSNGSLTANAAMAYVEARRPTSRVLYNLACARAQQKEFDKARDCLNKALEYAPAASRKRLEQRAFRDPSLKPMMEWEGYAHLTAQPREHSRRQEPASVIARRFAQDLGLDVEVKAEDYDDEQAAEESRAGAGEEPAAEAEAEETE